MAMWATSSGKAYLAALPGDEVDAVLNVGMTRHTPATVTEARILKDQLDEVRSKGYATNRGEFTGGIYAVGPVWGLTLDRWRRSACRYRRRAWTTNVGRSTEMRLEGGAVRECRIGLPAAHSMSDDQTSRNSSSGSSRSVEATS